MPAEIDYWLYDKNPRGPSLERHERCGTDA